MRPWWTGLAALILLAGCAGLPAGVPTTLTPLSQAELKFKLIDRFGPPVYCDPDQYPLARADPVRLARQHLPEIQSDRATYQAILRRHGFSGARLSDEQALAVYQDWKMLKAVQLIPRGSGYTFQGFFIDSSYTGNALVVLAVSGTIDRTGAIEVASSVRTAPPPCPI